MTWRDAVRVGAVLTGAAGVLLLGAPSASAIIRDDGDDPGSPMSTLGWIFLFIVVPVALYLIIWLLTYLPSMARRQRYRPDSGWQGEPVWFDGPPRAASAGAGGAAGHGNIVGNALPGAPGGAPASGSVGAVALDTADAAAPAGPAGTGSLAGGGASGRW